MKVKEKIIFLFKTKLGWRLIAGTTFITIGIIAIFISPNLKSSTVPNTIIQKKPPNGNHPVERYYFSSILYYFLLYTFSLLHATACKREKAKKEILTK